MNTKFSTRPGGATTGYTLTELLIVIVIIAILAALLMPVISGIQRKAGTAKSSANMRQIGMLMLRYAGDNNTFPPTYGTVVDGSTSYTPWQHRLLSYLDQPPTSAALSRSEIFWSPNATRLGGNARHYGMNIFIWHSSSGWKGRSLVIPEPSKIILVGETNRNSDVIRPSIAPTYEPDVALEYRVSNPGKMGLYLFADGHVEALEGDQGYSANPANHPKWRWWMDENGNEIAGLKP